MTNKPELLPCPFCGGAADKIRSSGDERDGYADHVSYVCSGCGCCRGAVGDSSKGGYADNSQVEALALAAWNTRAASAEDVRAVGEEPLDWSYCPECGCDEVRHQEGKHKQCAKCHQEWFSSIDYSDVVQGNLIRLHTSVGETAELRRRIATADQLLRDYYGDAHLCAFKAKDINAFLSASAKPEGGEE